MAVSLEQFVENLVRSGLFSAAELSAFQESFAPEKRPKDAQGLARSLNQAGKLTKYQAAAIYQGKTKGLALDEYIVLDRIGAGGMGEVFKARHRTMERVVALKVLPLKAMKSPDAVQRFHREVRAAAKLTHPNIVTAYDAREHEGIHCLVMEYVDGKDLANVLADEGPLPVEQAVDYARQAARGLEYAHEQGVIHRDIKPGNLLVDRKGTVKILDMGLARIGAADTSSDPKGGEPLTASGQMMGTWDYMAPEQAADTHGAD
ncbi:MAG: serine/threonine protein kinase, partial [Planctomycetes bacterium]|nr:serine/threonine protein kinase [Planctomycetota bacterium]